MTDAFVFIVVVLAVLLILIWLAIKPRKKNDRSLAMPDNYRQLLSENVAFYQRLDENGKAEFEKRIQHFLSSVHITGAGVQVEDIDRIFISASAIIPIYAFPHWEYINIREVLLYPESFNEQFETTGNDRAVLGMVGDGPMQQVMILSQYALREGFQNKTDKRNTAIHEFVHLLDRTDGATDGIPEVLLQNQYILPWLNMMHRNIKEMLSGKSDINPYGTTNQAEFFAVVSEYFFERPDILEAKHPELFVMLNTIFGKSNK